MKKEGVTLELNKGTDFHLKKAETGAKKLLLRWQKEQQISFAHSPTQDRSDSKDSKI